MKILAPTDFSTSSYNSLQWLKKYSETAANVSVEVMHCLEATRRSPMFAKSETNLKERAIHDLQMVKTMLDPENNNDAITTTLFQANPKSFTPERAKETEADLIVMGSTGLNAVKEITFGSVADYIARFSTVPVLIIPDGIDFTPPRSVVVGLGDDHIVHPEKYLFLNKFLAFSQPQIYLSQVVTKERKNSIFEKEIVELLDIFPVESKYLPLQKNIIQTLHLFAQEVSADLICLMHQPRGWLGRVLQPSITKDAMYDLRKPLLIISDQDVDD